MSEVRMAERRLHMERLDLAIERITQISVEDRGDDLQAYFEEIAEFILYVDGLRKKLANKEEFTLAQLEDIQYMLYNGISEKNYAQSIYNPSFMYDSYGEIGKVLALLAVEIRSIIPMIYGGDDVSYTGVLELFLEVYVATSDNSHKADTVEDTIYWYVSDYMDRTVPARIMSIMTEKDSLYKDIIMNSDLTIPNYLYSFGEYIGQEQIEVSKYLASLPEETIELMANTYTEGYRRGFEIAGKDLSRKKYVLIRYYIGFERVIRKAIKNFEAMGLSAIIPVKQYRLADKVGERISGTETMSPNKQYDYDHRFDDAILIKKALLDRKLTLKEEAYNKYNEYISLYAGPAVLEVFGEKDWTPVNDEHAYNYDNKIRKTLLSYQSAAGILRNKFIKGDEISFTIIAWPLPGIADESQSYTEIFNDIIAVNTLDSIKYQKLQQIIIDSLDRADYVEVKGREDNQTNIRVKLHKLNNPAKETNFENCVADINIPVGEVFTSPVLKGTEGLLHVSQVYIGDYQFKNLKLYFKDGMVSDYSCENFDSIQENRKLIEEVLLKNHPSLPMGEFAIGTNTTAYAIAGKYNILRKLPILIVEKMGPHFAIGDTCYSHEEDYITYNPDGKAIVARENECSSMRHEDADKAYFNCHTDITIPYDEIGYIAVFTAKQDRVDIIRDGRFVLEGIEELNIPIDAGN